MSSFLVKGLIGGAESTFVKSSTSSIFGRTLSSSGGLLGSLAPSLLKLGITSTTQLIEIGGGVVMMIIMLITNKKGKG
jgi:hypothetical protein